MAEPSVIKVPPRTIQRLTKILDQLTAKRSAKRCSTLHKNNCSASGIHGVSDIEDMAIPGRRRHSRHFHDDNSEILFNPKAYMETMKPLLEASTLPSAPYNSELWFNRELDRIFLPAWILVGREDEIAEAGEYLAMDTEWSGPVAVCRGNDGKVHAFANVCRHRGAKVVPGDKGKGSALGLVCPYHAWTYNFDGTLKWAPGLQKSKGFDETEVRLTPIRLELFHGFVFVNVSPKARPLRECLGDLPMKLPEWFGPKGAAQNTVCVKRREYEVACNWKFLMENTCETYHTSVVHKSSLGPMKASPVGEHHGDWDAVRVPSERSIVPLPGDFKGDRAPLPPFTDQTAFVNLFPSLQINVTWDCLWWMHLLPKGPSATTVRMGFCFPKTTIGLDVFPSRLERYLHRWHTAVGEDNMISLNQQRGVMSMFREPGRFCQLEFGTHNFNNWLLSRMLDGYKGRWDPGKRQQIGDGTIWSNDDARMLALSEESDRLQKETAAKNKS